MEDYAEEQQDFTPSRARMLRGAIAAGLILVVGVVAFRGFSKMRKRPKKKAAVKVLSLKVSVRDVKLRTIPLFLRGFGTAEPSRRLDVVPQVSGKVVYTLKPEFKVGAFVRRGKTMVVVDRSDYSIEYRRLKATIASTIKQIKIAERAYRVSQRNLGRSRRLVQTKALDPSSFERSEQQVLDRGQRLESLRQALAVNKILLSRAALNLRRTALAAPFDARVSRGSITRGTFVAAGRSIGTIESIDSIEIPVAFGLDALRKIQTNGEGDVLRWPDIPKILGKLPPVKVSVDNMKWKARVSRVASSLDRSTRTLTLYVTVDLRKTKQVGSLLPGTFCRVKIPARNIEQAVSIPRQALYQDNIVYLVENKKIVSRKVQVAYLDSARAVIVGGLRDGDRVIVTQLDDPIEGTPVVIGKSGGKS